MNTIVNMKEQWLNTIQPILTGFSFNFVDDMYVRETKHSSGGQTIIINGQRMEQPGQSYLVKYIIRFNGDGWIANEDETNQRPFTQVVFETSTNNENPQHIVEMCLYWDEPDILGNYIKQIFKL